MLNAQLDGLDAIDQTFPAHYFRRLFRIIDKVFGIASAIRADKNETISRPDHNVTRGSEF